MVERFIFTTYFLPNIGYLFLEYCRKVFQKCLNLINLSIKLLNKIRLYKLTE